MSESKIGTVCFMTLTHAGDIRQFSLLRRSIELFASDFPHIAIVNTEDCAQFEERFHGERHLQIIATADVLPGDIERGRRKSGTPWLTGRKVHRRHLRSGQAEQLTRLYALAAWPYEAAAFIASDVPICRALAPDYFYTDGRLKLFRHRATNAERLDYDISTHDILGNPLHQVTHLYDYSFSPAAFRKSSAIRLFAELERHKRSKWVRRFLAQHRPSEYNLLGHAAMVLEGGAGYHLIECDPEDPRHSTRFPGNRDPLTTELAAR